MISQDISSFSIHIFPFPFIFPNSRFYQILNSIRPTTFMNQLTKRKKKKMMKMRKNITQFVEKWKRRENWEKNPKFFHTNRKMVKWLPLEFVEKLLIIKFINLWEFSGRFSKIHVKKLEEIKLRELSGNLEKLGKSGSIFRKFSGISIF